MACGGVPLTLGLRAVAWLPRSLFRCVGWQVKVPGWWAFRLLWWGYMVPLFRLVRMGGVVQHLFMVLPGGDDMTSQNPVRESSCRAPLRCHGSRADSACPAKEGVDTVNTYVCFINSGGDGRKIARTFKVARGTKRREEHRRGPATGTPPTLALRPARPAPRRLHPVPRERCRDPIAVHHRRYASGFLTDICGSVAGELSGTHGIHHITKREKVAR